MKILTLSFDDCEIYDRRLCELLRSFDLRATFYLLSGLLGQEVPFRRYGEDTFVRRVTAQELPYTYAGMEIGCHTRFHRFSDEELEADIARPYDDEYIAEIAHEQLGLCYPQEIIYISGEGH